MAAKSVLTGLVVVLSLTLAVSGQQADTADRFFQAIRQNDLAALRTLAQDHGANGADAFGQTPLMMASAFGTVDAVRLLLDRGADVKAASAQGITALHLAVRDVRKVRLLIDAGADIHAATQVGRTPLLNAASTADASDVVRVLVERGARIDVSDAGGVTPLSAAATVDNLEVVRLMLERRADPNSAGPIPARFALSSAAANGNLEMVQLLLARGADVNAATSDRAAPIVKNGQIQFASVTALHLAVVGGNPQVVARLLDAGARVDPQDVRGMTPLMFAVATDRPQVEIIRLLLQKGADAALRSKVDESARDWALKFNNPAVLAALSLRPVATAPVTTPLASTGSARAAAALSMPLLRTASARMMTDGGCVACHAQPLSAMAAELQAARGWPAERGSLDAVQAAGSLTGNVTTLLQARELGGSPDSQLFISLMLATSRAPASIGTDAVVYYLAAKQMREGNWHVAGGTRAPIQDGDYFRTAMAIQAFKTFGTPALRAEFDARIERAARWLAAQSPITTQDRAMQLLGLHWADASAPVRASRTRELIALQRGDGGWAQTPHLDSDAYATGQVLYTLRQLGVPASEPALQRGAEFLVRTQRADGSWYVRNRAMKIQPYFESGFPYGHDQWISQTATTWAVIGLAVAAPDAATTTSAAR